MDSMITEDIRKFLGEEALVHWDVISDDVMQQHPNYLERGFIGFSRLAFLGQAYTISAANCDALIFTCSRCAAWDGARWHIRGENAHEIFSRRMFRYARLCDLREEAIEICAIATSSGTKATQCFHGLFAHAFAWDAFEAAFQPDVQKKRRQWAEAECMLREGWLPQ